MARKEPQRGGNSADVLVVIRAPLEQYPPSLFQVALLAEAGLRVVVVDTSHPEIRQQPFLGDVRRVDGGRHLLLYRDELPGQWHRIRNYFKFVAVVRRTAREMKPRVLIAYDDRACSAVGKALRVEERPYVISHFHELSVYNPGDGWGGWQAHRYCGRFARESDLVVFPDTSRAQIFQQRAELEHLPSIVMNCPRKAAALPPNDLPKHLAPAGLANHRVVLFQGWMGPNRGLESLISSMPSWPKDSALVLIGPAPTAYKDSLADLATRVGMRPRLLLIDRVSLNELTGLIVGADVAVALFPPETSDLNFRYLAGASNKRFMYMSLGVAQVTNQGPGVAEIFETAGCSRLVDPTSPAQIAEAITALLNDEPRRRRMGEQGRAAHLREFNYEHQFAPVLERIMSWTQA